MTSRQDRLNKLSYQSLADLARDEIRKAIFEGKIKPDEKLSIERIATELGISRTPVREALKTLESDGIIRILPSKGLVVQRFAHDELTERYAVRGLLEGYAGEIACRKQDPALIAELEANLAAMEAKAARIVDGQNDLPLFGELVELNVSFHKAILKASGCGVVPKVLDSLQMPLAYRLYQWRVPERKRAVVEDHRELIAAFRANDPARVRQVLERHIQDTSDFLIATDREPAAS